MLKKALLIFAVLFLAFIGFVSTKNGQFRYERSTVINAPADKIFPYLSDFKKGSLWNPYEEKDPHMKKTYSGTEGQPGSILDFEGNQDVGSGRLEVLKTVPNQSVDLKLTMIKPIHGENLINYQLTSEGNATRFTWSMSGDGGFPMKLMSVFIDCEKMITGDFEKGFQNLKKIVETQAAN